MSEKKGHSARAHALLSASSAHRWLACPPSAVAAEAYPRQDTAFTREGTLAHEVAEAAADWSDQAEEIKQVYGTFDDYLDLKIREEERDDVTQEMVDCAFAYAEYIEEQIKGPDAVLLLEQRVDFSPWVPDGFGTADCIIIQGDTMDVIDYKYGKGVAVSAIDNAQMKYYGLGALNDFGFAYDIRKIRLHIFQPRMNNISVDEIDDEALVNWGNSNRYTASLAAAGMGDYSAGEHCRFCPHAGRCKTLTQTCTEYIETHGLKASVEVLAPWEVADVLQRAPLIELWIKRVKDQALTTLLDGGEIPGFKVVAGRGSRNWADDLEVGKLLEGAGVSKEDYTKTELLSVAQMEKAIGKKKVAEILGGQILTHTGAPTVVPESDKRPKYDRLAEAKADFE